MRKLGVFALSLLALAGCSSVGPSTQSPVPSISAPPPDTRIAALAAPTTLDASTYPRVVATPVTTTLPAQVSGTIPTVDVIAAFNKAVAHQVATWVQEFEGSKPAASRTLAISWKLLVAAGPWVGVEVSALEAGVTKVASFYGNSANKTVVTGSDLITPDGAQLIYTMAATHPVPNAAPSATASAGASTAGQSPASGTPASGTNLDSSKVEPKHFVNSVAFTKAGEVQVTMDTGSGLHTWQITAAATPSVLSDQGSAIAALVSAGTALALPRPPVDCATTKCIALTFDDGPGNDSAGFVDVLTAKDAPATFFFLGVNTNNKPASAKLIADAGFQVCSHAYSHHQLAKMNADQIAAEINSTREAIAAATGVTVNCFRPPYGQINPTIKSLAGTPIYLWNNDTEDWKNKDPNITHDRAMQAATAGGVILMHETHPSTLKQLPRLIDDLRAKGYTLVTIDELYAGLDLQPGQVVRYRG